MNDLLDLDFDPGASRTASPFLRAPTAKGASANYNTSPPATAPAASFGLPPSRTTTPLARPSSAAPKQDAFSGLFMSASTGGSSDAGHHGLSLVERQRKMDQDRAEKQQRERDAFNFDSWGHAGASSAGPNSGVPLRSSPAPSVKAISLTGTNSMLRPSPASSVKALPLAASTPVTRPPSASGKVPSWNFNDLLAPPTAAPPRSTSTSPAPHKPPIDPWDMAIFDNAVSTKPEPRRFETEVADEDEDVLGLLSMPVAELEIEADERPKSRAAETRPRSPPPHIIGQIVEMGFAPLQARQALAQTSTGVDVQAALEMLLANGGQERKNSSDGDRDDEEAARLEMERERRRRRRQGPSRSTAPPERTQPSRETDEMPFVDQADKIIAQASAVGMSVFSKANSLWNVGKERAQKLYEERAAAAAAAGGVRDKGKAVDGRPRWMIDAEEAQAAREEPMTNGRQPPHRFADLDDQPTRRADRPREEARRPVENQRSQPDLLGGSESHSSNHTYRSPARRKPVAGAALVSSAPTSGQSTPRRPTPATAPSLKRRQYTRASSTQLSTSATFKESGNSYFKLGAYGEAVEAYTKALEALPSDHILRVPLYTNRAAAYLKQGEHLGAIEDCTKAISLVGINYHPAKEAALDDDAAKDVRLADGLIKALCKRASAYEMGEKWKQAKEDWQSAMSVSAAAVVFGSAGGANVRKMVGEGLTRASKMCSVLEKGADPVSAAPSTKSTTVRIVAQSKPPPSPPTPANSAGVAAMRAAASAAESEEDLRLKLKDSVDKRIETWSKGKETNLRGLLASLDLVLDKDEAMWKEVKRPGMAELITDKQLKIGYMKVIGRLHPDKLNTSNSSVEQRMIANSVFGILNEAWHAHSGA